MIIKLAITGFNVTFSEKGLPSGTLWNVTFMGNTNATTFSSIEFTNASADFTYPFNVTQSILVKNSPGVRYESYPTLGKFEVTENTKILHPLRAAV